MAWELPSKPVREPIRRGATAVLDPAPPWPAEPDDAVPVAVTAGILRRRGR